MAVAWGASEGTTSSSVRVGIEFSQSPSNVTSSTTSVTLTARYFVQCTSGSWDDTQALTVSGSDSGTKSFHNGLSDGQLTRVNEVSMSVPLYYGSRAQRTFNLSLSGAYNGATPSKSATYTAPYRPVGKPDAPSRPTVSNVTSQAATINWTRPDGNGDTPDQANVQVARSESFWSGGMVLDGTTGGWQSDWRTGTVDRATTYYARVRVRNSAGWSNWSPIRSFTTDPEVPNAPVSGLRTVSATTASIAVNPPSDNGGRTVDLYQAGRSTSNNSPGSTTPSQASTSITFTGLEPNTTYYWWARAHNSVGWGPWSSSTRSFKTAYDNPTKPRSLGSSDISSSGATVAWTAPSDWGSGSETSDRTYSWVLSRSGTIVDTDTGLTSTSRSLSGLAHATTYTFEVEARNGGGLSSGHVSLNFKTSAVAPTTAGAPSVSNIGPETATFSWSAPYDGGSPITGYDLYIRNLETNATQLISLGTATSTTRTDLIPGTPYTVQVRATNEAGTSYWSNARPFETLSGASIKVNGAWRTARAYIKVNGSWRTVRVWKKAGGAWTP